MLTPWLADPLSRERLAAWSDAAHLDLAAHGTTSDAATIRDTAIAQPLIVAASLLAYQALSDAAPTPTLTPTPTPASTPTPTPASTPAPTLTPTHTFVLAGHSVGEFTAAAIAGVLTPAQAIALVAERGRAMAECAQATETGMSAVIGGERSEVLARIAEAGLTAANINGAGQVVAAGPLTALAALETTPPPRTRIRRLDVAGAFHTPFMSPAESHLARAVQDLAPGAPSTTPLPILSNLDGEPVTDASVLVNRLIAQVTLPVRWDLVMRTMSTLPLTHTVELAPAGVLTGLVHRDLPAPTRFTLDSPDAAGPVATALTARTAA